MSEVPVLGMQVDDEIQLRLVEERHADEYYALIDSNRGYLREWMGWVDRETSAESLKEFIHRRLLQFAHSQGLPLGIWYQGKLAGVISFNYIDYVLRKADIGYWLDARLQGRGIMTRACRALIELGFGEYGLNKIEIRCAVGNRPSRAIPERLGFQQEGILRANEWLYDRYVDMVIYGMLASEWRERGEAGG